VAGAERLFGGPSNQVGWLIKMGDNGCSANVGQAVTGLTMLPNNHPLLAVLTDAGTTALAEFSGCSLEKLTPVPLPEPGGPNHLHDTGRELYLIGAMGGTNNNDRGYLAMRGSDDKWTFAAPVDPNVAWDTLNYVDTDGASLFAVGHQNANLAGAITTVYRYALPLEAGAGPVSSTVAFGGDLLLLGDFKASPLEGDALFVTGSVSVRPGGDVARCSKSTGCR
jgi:hypothetical protein